MVNGTCCYPLLSFVKDLHSSYDLTEVPDELHGESQLAIMYFTYF